MEESFFGIFFFLARVLIMLDLVSITKPLYEGHYKDYCISFDR